MSQDQLDAKAIEQGRTQAQATLARRAKAHGLRAAALDAHIQFLNALPDGQRPSEAALASRSSAGVLVAEGDSWFDYPFYDILELLEDEHAYDVESVAHRGDPMETMAYGGSQREDFLRRIEKVMRGGQAPKAILLSGGGDDIAGDAFGMLLNHAGSSIAGLNESIVKGVIDERLRIAFISMLSAVTELCTSKLGRPVPILVHGYGYPVPDGRGFLGGWGPLPGPWLQPGFQEKGFGDLQQCTDLMVVLIDRFNAMLQSIQASGQFPHLHYVDLRPVLSNELAQRKYRESWGNELHPTSDGFGAVTDRFVAVLNAL